MGDATSRVHDSRCDSVDMSVRDIDQAFDRLRRWSGCGGNEERALRTAREAVVRVRRLEAGAGYGPGTLRERGWMVAVHNDYRQDGASFTFWLFTKGDFAIKGEGRTDDIAIAAALLEADRVDALIAEVSRG